MKTISFDTTLSTFGKNTGIEIPNEIMKQLDAGKRPSLLVKVNGYEYQCTPGIMGGKTLISFNSQHREKSKIQGGDDIHVELTLADTPRKVEMSPDFLKSLENSGTKSFFESLSNSLQRYHCDLINVAKTEETRKRRIKNAVEIFKQGKKR